MSITVLDPTAAVVPRPAGLAPRLATLHGSTIALLDNGKKNVTSFLDQLEAILREQYGVGATVRLRKKNQNAPAPPAIIKELAKADAAVSAVGD